MGCGSSAESQEQTRHNDEINRQLRKDHLAEQRIVKLLLLGAGESGKTTIFKQAKILHCDGLSEEERMVAKLSILNNTLGSIRSLVTAAGNMGLTLAQTDAANAVMDPQYEVIRAPYPPTFAVHISALWKNDPAIKEAYKRRSEFQLLDNAAYFLDNADRTALPEYTPTVQDILLSRVKTSGVSDIDFTAHETRFKLVDVGGQRSERKKWINCFDDVAAVLFVVALSEFDLLLYEDSSTNRLEESLRLFKDTCEHTAFPNTPFILVLNKEDIFDQKVSDGTFASRFPDFKGTDTNAASQFIRDKFIASSGKKVVATHNLCATNTDNVRALIKDVTAEVLSQLSAKEASGA
ncbi:guanine nucleotide-binding protein alpha-1 subunit [Pelomyxa schiedti]|nr:guanine nucleotide-binding protein alpha-1 subunit [Pelomyxa schiedti]